LGSSQTHSLLDFRGFTSKRNLGREWGKREERRVEGVVVGREGRKREVKGGETPNSHFWLRR